MCGWCGAVLFLLSLRICCGFKLACEPLSIDKDNAFIHLQHVSLGLQDHIKLMKNGVIQHFDAWSEKNFNTSHTVRIFNSTICYRAVKRSYIQDAYNVIEDYSGPNAAVLDALWNLKDEQWPIGEKRRHIAFVYTIYLPSTKLAQQASEEVTIKAAIRQLRKKSIYVAFVVPESLVREYKKMFADLGDQLAVVRMMSTAQEMENELYAAMNKFYCNVDTFTPPKPQRGSCMHDVVLQILHVQDVSSSMTNDINDLKGKLVPLYNYLSYKFKTQFGLATFIDKPRKPFGFPSDYCYREDLGFTTDVKSFLQKLNSVRITGGMDQKYKSQYDAIVRGIESENLGWISSKLHDNKPVLRAVVLATNAYRHQKGDAKDLPGWSPRGCEFSDYPSDSEVNEGLFRHDIVPIFLVTPNVLESWRETMTNLSPLGHVVDLTGSIDVLKIAIEKTLNEFCKSIEFY